jgi:flagellin-like protein
MKGISPLIASVMLIAFVMAIGILVMGWMSTLTRTTTATVTNSTDTAIGCSSASINIDEVYVTTGSTNGTVRAIVKNTGYKDGMQVSNAVLLTNTGMNYSVSNPTLPYSNFNKGDIVTLQFSNVSIASCTSFSKVIVTTNCGGISDTFSGTPKCST